MRGVTTVLWFMHRALLTGGRSRIQAVVKFRLFSFLTLINNNPAKQEEIRHPICVSNNINSELYYPFIKSSVLYSYHWLVAVYQKSITKA